MSIGKVAPSPIGTAVPVQAAVESLSNPFDVALAQYVLGLMQISAVLVERQQQGLRAYVESAAAVPPSDQGACTREYQELIAAVRNRDADSIASSQAAYLDSLRKLQGAVVEGAGAAMEQYLSEVRNALEEARTECQTRYEAYVGDVSEAFRAVSAGSLDPAALAAIGQTLVAASAYASTSMQALEAVDARRTFGGT
jgi:hypothetical protein